MRLRQAEVEQRLVERAHRHRTVGGELRRRGAERAQILDERALVAGELVAASVLLGDVVGDAETASRRGMRASTAASDCENDSTAKRNDSWLLRKSTTPVRCAAIHTKYG